MQIHLSYANDCKRVVNVDTFLVVPLLHKSNLYIIQSNYDQRQRLLISALIKNRLSKYLLQVEEGHKCKN